MMVRWWGTLVACGLVAGCAGSAPDAGRDRPPERIVSFVPAVTDLLLAIGQGDRLVGAMASDTAEALRGLPRVGDALSPAPEPLLQVRPDLVILSGPGVVPAVGTLTDRTRILTAEILTLGDLRTFARELGAVLHAERTVDSLLTQFDVAIDGVRGRTAYRRPPRVAYVAWYDPLVVAGHGSYPDELLGITGAENVFRDVTGEWPRISLEALVAADLDFLLVGIPGDASSPLPDAWPGLLDLEPDRIHFPPASLFDTPSVRSAPDAVRILHLYFRDFLAER